MQSKTFLLYAAFCCSTSILIGQINDYTPNGDWSNFSLKSIENGAYLQITGYPVDGQPLSYILDNGELFLLEPDSSLTAVNYMDNLGHKLFFQTTDINGIKRICFYENYEIQEVPTDRNWHPTFLPTILSDNTMFAPLLDEEAGFYYPTVISEDSLFVLSDVPYNLISFKNFEEESRIYWWGLDTSAIGFSGTYTLGYYDVIDGSTITNIGLNQLDILSNNPSDSIHILIINGTQDSIASKIYRVVDHTFTEITVPGGPYDQLDLLYRNDDTRTSLFEAKDYKGHVKLIKRQEGNWSDLTASFPSFDLLHTELQVGDELFLNVRKTSGERELWFYQSTAFGDTLANITPPTGPYDHIKYVQNSLIPFSTFEFENIDDEYYYTYFNGLSTLLPPSVQLINPNGLPAQYIYLYENGVYSFHYYNSDSSATFEHLYHQKVSGGDLTLLNDSTNTDRVIVCSSPEFVMFKSIDFNATEEFFFYNLDSVSKLTFPNRDKATNHELIPFGDRGCMVEKQGDTIDSSIFLYTLINKELIDITHPRWRNVDTDDYKDYNGKELVSYVKNIEDPNKSRLWGITTEPRKRTNCNTDFKFFQDEIGFTQNDVGSIYAKEIYVGSFFSDELGQDFNVENHLEFLPGTSIETQLHSFEVSIENCSNAPMDGH